MQKANEQSVTVDLPKSAVDALKQIAQEKAVSFDELVKNIILNSLFKASDDWK